MKNALLTASLGLGLFLPALIAQKTTDVRVNAGTPGTGRIYSLTAAASGDAVYVVWIDDRDRRYDIYFNRSLDGGATWLRHDLRLNTVSQANSPWAPPAVVASGDAVYVSWDGSRDGPSEIDFNRSLDRGTTWLPAEVKLSPDPQTNQEGSVGPRIAVQGDAVYVSAAYWREGTRAVHVHRSLDRGASWQTRVLSVSEGSYPAQIAVAGERVYLMWSRRGDLGLFFNRSLDRGETWLANEVRVNTNAGSYWWMTPHLSVSGDSVYATWHANRGDADELRFNGSLDGGVTWRSSDLVLNGDPIGARPPGPGGSNFSYLNPQIASSGSSVYVVWEDSRNGGVDIYFNCSRDRGVTWLEEDVRLNTAPVAYSEHARIAAAGDSVYAVWSDYREGWQDIRFNRSLDRGATWLSDDVRLDSDAPGSAMSIFTELAVSGESVYVVWGDSRHHVPATAYETVPYDIYCNIPFGARPYGAGSAGSGGAVPQLSGSDGLHPGGTYTVTVSGGRGGATGAIGFGYRPDSQASLPLFGGTLLVDPIEVCVPFVLDGNGRIPGTGTFSVDIPIPPQASLLGFNLNAQAVILDPGAAGGAALTNAVEAWIL